MSCPDCIAKIADLESQVRALRTQIGEQARADQVHKIARHLQALGNRWAPGCARVLVALLGAQGRPVSLYALLEAVPPLNKSHDPQERSENQIRIWASAARRDMPPGSIETVRNHGYLLTEIGRAWMSGILGGQT